MASSTVVPCEKLTPRAPATARVPDTPRATRTNLLSFGYKLGDRLDQGTYGVIHSGVHLQTKQPLIIKELAAYGYRRQVAAQEGQITSLAAHPFVVKLFDQVEIDDRLFLVMQYARGGDLHNRILSSPEGRMNVVETKRVFAQLILALSNLHKKNIVHIDIKPENVFLDENNNVLLGDFGLSGVFKPKSRTFFPKAGTIHYAAPETIIGQSVEGPELDVWSAGVVLYTMLEGRYAFWGETDDDIASAVMFQDPTWSEHFPAEAIDLLKQMLTKNPRKRISISKIKKHPFIKFEIQFFRSQLHSMGYRSHHHHKRARTSTA